MLPCTAAAFTQFTWIATPEKLIVHPGRIAEADRAVAPRLMVPTSAAECRVQINQRRCAAINEEPTAECDRTI